jgi:hypothetical protein
MALIDLSSEAAPYTSDTGTASTSATEQTLPAGTKTVTIQATGAITWGYTSARLFPLAADTPLEIPVGPEPGDPTPHVESLWIKSDSGTPTVYLDCSPYRR